MYLEATGAVGLETFLFNQENGIFLLISTEETGAAQIKSVGIDNVDRFYSCRTAPSEI